MSMRQSLPGSLPVDICFPGVADMPPLAGVGSEPGPSSDKPSITEILTTPVREGGEDDWTRFQGASAAIGHYVRMAHEGRMSRDDAWEAICQYNAAQLRPSWPLERLASEAQLVDAPFMSRAVCIGCTSNEHWTSTKPFTDEQLLSAFTF